MYCYIRDNFYIALCADDLVVLDLISDRYHIVSGVDADFVMEFFSVRADSRADLSELELALGRLGCIERRDQAPTLPPFRTPAPYTGVWDPHWRLPIVDPQHSSWITRFQAIIALTRATIAIRGGGLAGVRKTVGSQKTHQLRCKIKTSEIHNETTKCLSALDSVFFLSLASNRCLLHSTALVLMLRKRGYDARIVVGVRTRPFFSHAWVEVSGTVINDDIDVSGRLSVIMEL